MKKRVAVVGATGIAGQQFLAALDRHPWFEVARARGIRALGGQAVRARRIRDAKTGARRWWCAEEPPAAMLGPAGRGRRRARPRRHRHRVHRRRESDAARELEPRFAKTTGGAQHRLGVPLRGRRADHGAGRQPRRTPAQIDAQRRERGWQGFVVPLPNCTTMGLVVTLEAAARPLRHRARGDDLDAGHVRRRPLAGRRRARHPRQHHPVHPRRGGEGRARDRQDPRRRRRGRHRARARSR